MALCRVQGATPAIWNFAPVVHKVFPRFVTGIGRSMAENSDSIFSTEVRPDGLNLKIFSWREYFLSEVYSNSTYSFFPGFFIRFGRHMAKISDSVLSTRVRPEAMFDTFNHGETIFLSRYFRPVVRPVER